METDVNAVPARDALSSGDTLPDVSAPTAGPSAWLWESPLKTVSVYLDFDLVDRLNFDIMRGFGAVPRRGAEVGGLLLGTLTPGTPAVIRVDDYIQISCEHMRGPSLILSDRDIEALDEHIARWSQSPDKRRYIVGFFRSNTRDSIQPSAEDYALLDAKLRCNPLALLLVKPFATRINEGVLAIRENGTWPQTPAEPFPFRRKEMGGGTAATRSRRLPAYEPDPPVPPRPATEAMPPAVDPDQPAPEPPPPAAAVGPTLFGVKISERELDEPIENVIERETGSAPKSKFRSGWVWIPLSFIFLLLGVVLGFQIALSYRNASRPPDSQTDPYNLNLSILRFGDNLHLKWGNGSIPLSRAQKGILTIQDGAVTKTVELSKDDLTRGGVLYKNSADTVRFRLEVFPRENNSVSESVEIKVVK